MASAKRVSELHALSVSETCIRWYSLGTGVALWPNPYFLQKRLPSAHLNQIIELAAYDSSASAEHALSKQRLSRWIVEVIEEACRSRGLPLPLNVRGHTTRNVSTSWAALRGVHLQM